MKAGAYRRLCATNETVRWFYGPWLKMPSGMKHKIQRMTRSEIIAEATAKRLGDEHGHRLIGIDLAYPHASKTVVV